VSFTYDDNGNLTGDGVRSYTWDERNQLASFTGPVNGSFPYDGVGRRRAKTIGGTTTQFLYGGLNLLQELSGGSPVANLLTGLGIDEYFTRTDAAGMRHFLTDALGSSVALLDGSGCSQRRPGGARPQIERKPCSEDRGRICGPFPPAQSLHQASAIRRSAHLLQSLSGSPSSRGA
jgi:hypothetical protein